MMSNKKGINRLNDDTIYNILARLPASSFVAASCVSKTWYRVSTKIISRPKIISALSLNPLLTDAVDEVLDKVLCKPIRPDFVVACMGDDFGLKLAHQLLTRKLGAKTPLVTHLSNGVMGIDALTDQLKEVQWEYFDYTDGHPREHNAHDNTNQGILLIVGCLPGLKVDAIPLFHPKAGSKTTMVHRITNFISEIKAYTATVSEDEFPMAIMTFGDLNHDVNSLIAKMDYDMPKETAIVGDGGGCFMFNSLNYTITSPTHTYALDAVALVFAKDKNKSPDIGETKFHVIMAGGLLPFKSPLKVNVVERKPSMNSSWISAKTEEGAIMIPEDLIETIKMAYDDPSPDLYIGVVKHRRYNLEESSNLETSIDFYHVMGCEDYFFIIEDGTSIRPGDSFKFYYRDLETASATIDTTNKYLEILKENIQENSKNNGVFGGLIFSCHSRGESYFKHLNYDTSPFTLNFPNVPVAGMFCKGEIGRGSSCLIEEDENKKQCPDHCCRHACSAVYLVMSYHAHPS